MDEKANIASSRSLSDLRIGYVPYSGNCSSPGDRRRFCLYAKRRGLSYEIARPGASYDAVFLSSLSDLTYWSRFPRNADCKLVYELIDSYLEIDETDWKARLRGPAKFLLRQHQHFERNYHESIRRMCRRADAVVCSTPEQKRQLSKYCSNIHDILDAHSGDVRRVKSNYKVAEPIHIVWEGMAVNLRTFTAIAKVLREVDKSHHVVLHLITDLEYKTLNGPVPKRATRRLVEQHLPGVEAYLYEWNDHLFAQICSFCDFAIIPMQRDSPLHMAKPENKLLLFWRMGIPTLTERTPAYQRVMKAAGVSMTCGSDAEWHEQLINIIENHDQREQAGRRGLEYVSNAHSEEILMKKWDALLASIVD